MKRKEQLLLQSLLSWIPVVTGYRPGLYLGEKTGTPWHHFLVKYIQEIPSRGVRVSYTADYSPLQWSIQRICWSVYHKKLWYFHSNDFWDFWQEVRNWWNQERDTAGFSGKTPVHSIITFFNTKKFLPENQSFPRQTVFGFWKTLTRANYAKNFIKIVRAVF